MKKLALILSLVVVLTACMGLFSVSADDGRVDNTASDIFFLNMQSAPYYNPDYTTYSSIMSGGLAAWDGNQFLNDGGVFYSFAISYANPTLVNEVRIKIIEKNAAGTTPEELAKIYVYALGDTDWERCESTATVDGDYLVIVLDEAATSDFFMVVGDASMVASGLRFYWRDYKTAYDPAYVGGGNVPDAPVTTTPETDAPVDEDAKVNNSASDIFFLNMQSAPYYNPDYTTYSSIMSGGLAAWDGNQFLNDGGNFYSFAISYTDAVLVNEVRIKIIQKSATATTPEELAKIYVYALGETDWELCETTASVDGDYLVIVLDEATTSDFFMVVGDATMETSGLRFYWRDFSTAYDPAYVEEDIVTEAPETNAPETQAPETQAPETESGNADTADFAIASLALMAVAAAGVALTKKRK